MCLLLQIKKKKKDLSRKWYGKRERKKNLWFVKKLVELHLVSGSIVLTVSVQYIRVWMGERLFHRLYVCVLCMCMYRHSISDLSNPPTQLSLEERPLKYCLPLVGYSNFSLF